MTAGNVSGNRWEYAVALDCLGATASNEYMSIRALRRFWERHQLTPQERANMRLAHSPLAVISASLGAHAPH
ncbi:hypothetical protein [Mycobacteroides salmoniphilum]|uniref:Uncharacterized protein n=1 Tax=Mycobacteroides salmoniphilum TaxID=404941 RepID=A0A4R8SP55_9MYCO|nr:hypothetical protein [Mycobacteroides salmoniphilum]TDZ90853.1 hypothetical protein CCUG62472_04107 [Mycobacteroides salmoniphilum]TEA00771.1 hypothetical protein CCUG60884_04664 [Mycobacteroides salmoniphilum]